MCLLSVCFFVLHTLWIYSTSVRIFVHQVAHSTNFIKNDRFLTITSNKVLTAQLSQRDRAAGCVIVFAKSRRLQLGDNILQTSYIGLSSTTAI